MLEKIAKLKEKHKKRIDMYSEDIKDHISRYGQARTDYLIHRLKMESYHRGAWNALNELEKENEDNN